MLPGGKSGRKGVRVQLKQVGFPPKLRPSSYISTTLFVWRILITMSFLFHNWQVGVQSQEANPLHLFDAYTQVENCKLENPNVQT